VTQRRAARRPREVSEALRPIKGVILLGADGVVNLPPDDVTVDRVGLKAWGICCLPDDWALPLLVVSGELADIDLDAPTLLSTMRSIGIPLGSDVIIRSSGVRESLRQRGRLASDVCKAEDVLRAIRKLRAEIGAEQMHVHWLVQPYRKPRALGHLSNERRLSYEKRDWVAEVEPRQGKKGLAVSVAVRRWRDGTKYTTGPILCSSEAQISVRLKTVAVWAMRASDRMHFEWLWDGNRLFVVQVDIEEISGGVDPRSAIDVGVANVEVGTLKAFRVCGPPDFADYRKLRNANLYSQLGYSMPAFYILANDEVTAVLGGDVSDSVRSDLAHLTARPLVIRTDGRDIPTEQREMLPRSDELRSAAEAVRWLGEELAPKIAAAGLAGAHIVLIAHHFIPAVASAWARAEPGKPHVRVEGLWGVPEGLYWYSHDTYQVDTQVSEMSSDESPPRRRFPLTKRIRYKGSFVAPDDTGAFVHRTTAPPLDWRGSIRKESWLSEIAWTTRRVAERSKQAIALMWFVDTHPGASPHAVLPWYHDWSRIDESPTAAPRNKYRYSSEFRIESASDWDRFRQALRSGLAIERVVVEPTDPSLVRNKPFADELATLAKDYGIVVELSGGILSHAYYVLNRAGAKVECVDLFGDETDVLEFDKLIRDKIPEGMAKRGEIAETVHLAEDAFILALQQKIVEEGFEVLDARSGEEMLAELADVLEVADALATALGTNRQRVDEQRVDKRRRRGGFDGGTMLLRTATPGTLNATALGAVEGGDLGVSAIASRTITDPALLPSRPPYRKPDLRQTSTESLEKVLTIEVDLARLSESLREAFQFSMPGARGADENFSISLELRRHAGALRAIVKLRRSDAQLSLPIE
jgi:predicted house-cleaning noncanonical NTP pyrophosphatase (MazG superfamily)